MCVSWVFSDPKPLLYDSTPMTSIDLLNAYDATQDILLC